MELLSWKLQHLAQRYTAQRTSLQPLHDRLHHTSMRMTQALRQTLTRRSVDLQRLAGNLHHLNPTRVMERGYSVVRDSTGSIVKSNEQIAVGDELRLSFARGEALANVTKSNSGN